MHMHMHMLIHMHTCMPIRIPIHIHMHIQTHIHARIHARIHTHTHSTFISHPPPILTNAREKAVRSTWGHEQALQQPDTATSVSFHKKYQA
jgi:hypothetical protein